MACKRWLVHSQQSPVRQWPITRPWRVLSTAGEWLTLIPNRGDSARQPVLTLRRRTPVGVAKRTDYMPIVCLTPLP